MSTHETGQLGAYSLGALVAAEAAEVERHLETCPDCRRELDELEAVHAQIELVPPEVLLDGAAEDSDLLLARILRAADQLTTDQTVRMPAATPESTERLPAATAEPTERMPAADTTTELPTTISGKLPEPRKAEQRRRPWYRGPLAAAAGVVILAGVFAGGIVLGHQSVPPAASTAAPPNTGTGTGSRTVSATDPATGVGMSMQLTSKAGWVDLQGHFTGVTPGTPCEIYLVSRAGERVLAGGWVAPANANTAVVTVDGSAIMDPDDVGSIEIDTSAGKRLVTARV